MIHLLDSARLQVQYLNGTGYSIVTLLLSGKVLCCDGNGTDAEIFDPVTNTFSRTGSTILPSTAQTATLLSNGQVLVTGSSQSVVTYGNAELYDPTIGTFSLTGPMIENRFGHRATLLQNGWVLITGGITEDWSAPSNTAEIYKPETKTFYHVSNMDITRAHHTSTLLHSGLVLVAGGTVGINAASNNAQLFDPATETFSIPTSMVISRTWAVASLLDDGQILIDGGSQGENFTPPLLSAELSKSCDQYVYTHGFYDCRHDLA